MLLYAVIVVVIVLGYIFIKWPQSSLYYSYMGTVAAAIILRYLGMAQGVLLTVLFLTLLGLFFYRIKYPVSIIRLSISEILMLCIAFLYWFSLARTPTPEYGFRKFQLFLAVCFILVFVARVFSQREDLFSQTLQALGWTSVVGLGLFLIIYITYRDVLTSSTGRFGAGLEGTGVGILTLSWAAASAIACSTYLMVKHWRFAFLIVPLQFGGIVTMLATGSRGPLGALFIGALFAFLTFKKAFQSFLIIVFVSLVIGLGFFFFTPIEARERIFSGFEGNAFETSGRTGFYRDGVMQYFDNMVIGGGAGSYAHYVGRGDIVRYPHNLILEIAGELGTVGLVPMILILAIAFVQFLKVRKMPLASPLYWEAKFIQWLFIIGFINAMVSFDITDQRNLFCAIGLLAGTARWESNHLMDHFDYDSYLLE